MIPTTSSTIVDPASTNASVAVTPYRRFFKARMAIHDPAIPTASPETTRLNPSLSIAAETCRGRAPSAIRMPISRRRCKTVYASSPYKPSAASSTASPANAAIDFNAVAPRRAHDGMYPLIGGVSSALFPWPKVEGDANVFGHEMRGRGVAVGRPFPPLNQMLRVTIGTDSEMKKFRDAFSASLAIG